MARARLVGTDIKLLEQLRQSGGDYPSQFKLITDAGVEYKYGFERLKYLHLREYVSIQVAQAGKPRPVKLNTQKEVLP